MISQGLFGTTKNGDKVHSFTLENSNGVKVVLLELGCIIQSFIVPIIDETTDIVLGYDKVEKYENCNSGVGALIGRHANRIKQAAFELNGDTYALSKNDGNNHLHGVFGKALFTGSIENGGVVFRYKSPHMEDGYPGNMDVTVTYTLANDTSLTIDYKAVCDEDSIINLTNHSYFNLDGQGTGDIYSHTLWLNCKSFCESDKENCPTGKILQTKNTPMDFTSSKAIGDDINSDYYQLQMASGYDHNFIIDKPEKELSLCAMAKSSDGNMVLEVFTTQPAIQLYTANFLHETGKNNVAYEKHHAFCIETQHYPCSTSFSHFPSVVLKKGEEFHEITIYKAYKV